MEPANCGTPWTERVDEIAREYRLLLTFSQRLAGRPLLSHYARDLIQMLAHSIRSALARLSEATIPATATGLPHDLSWDRAFLDSMWFCYTMVEHESNWESPSRGHSLSGASGYNNFGGMYRRYSIGGGGTLAFPDFPGDRLLFNGEAALVAALKVVALQHSRESRRLVLLFDSECGRTVDRWSTLFRRRFGWEMECFDARSLPHHLHRFIARDSSDRDLCLVAGSFSVLSGVDRDALATALHVISFGPLGSSTSPPRALLPQEIRIYFSPAVFQERLAIIFPPAELHRAFVIQQQRGGALNEWALKFFSFRFDQERVLDRLDHRL